MEQTPRTKDDFKKIVKGRMEEIELEPHARLAFLCGVQYCTSVINKYAENDAEFLKAITELMMECVHYAFIGDGERDPEQPMQ